MKLSVSAFLLVWLLAGCATSTIESRKQERYDSYATLSEEQRVAVDAGRIAIGLPMDGVYIAWGKPAQVVDSETPAGAFTSWLYSGTYLQGVNYWGYGGYWGYRPYCGYRYPYYGPALMSDYIPVNYVRAEVVFEAGRVKQWRTLPSPP